MVRGPLAGCFTEVKDGMQVLVRTCNSPFRISGMAGQIALKLDVCLGDH